MDKSLVSNLNKIKPDYVVHGSDWKTGVQSDIRKKVILFKDTDNDFKKWYKKQVSSMNEDQLKYKIGP